MVAILMIQRLYVHNFRCLENFELKMKNMPSALLIGKNGSGKSTVAAAFQILQKIGQGVNRIGQLVKPKDFAGGRSNIPIQLEIEVLIDERIYQYAISFELPAGFRELRIFEEKLMVWDTPIYQRKEDQVTLFRYPQSNEAIFSVDWHLVALPVIQEQSREDPLHFFKMWLSQMIILSPVPYLMKGESTGEIMKPNREVSNFGEWFSGLLSRYPAAYTLIDRYLRNVMPDFKDFRNEPIGKEAKDLSVRFQESGADLIVSFEDLSDGEKCFFLCAGILAANDYYGPLFCFWDEPDSHLSLSEVGHFILSLRRSFEKGGQFLATSHNSEAIQKFSDENTYMVYRNHHLGPTLLTLLVDTPYRGNLLDKLIQDDIEP